MSLRRRSMKPEDVAECARIIAEHPVLGARYGNRIGDLGPAWLRLLSFQGKRTTIFQYGDGPRAPICCVGVSVFVSDDFVRELKTPPLFWFAPELAKRVLRGDSPILSETQIREANSCGKMNLVTWEGCIRPGFESDNEIHRFIMNAFIEEHAGFFWKEIIGPQMESSERLQWTLKTGGLLWNPRTDTYADSLDKDPREIIRSPHIIGTTREMESRRPHPWAGSWVGSLFDYRPPSLGFSRSEQSLLLSAISGGTDEQLSDDLGISLSTVKKMWRSIYDRADSLLAKIQPGLSPGDEEMHERGKEKRRHILAYLRDHLEELRPVSRKLVQRSPGLHR